MEADPIRDLSEEEINRDFEDMISSLSESTISNNIQPEIAQSFSIDLPDPANEARNILCCAKCYKMMDVIMSFTASDETGICTDNFCTECVDDLVQSAGDEKFLCPACMRLVTAWGENRTAMILARNVNELMEQRQLFEQEQEQQRRFIAQIQRQQQAEREELQRVLEQERSQNQSLSQKLETLSYNYERERKQSESIISTMQRQINEIRESSKQQEIALQQEKERLKAMLQHKEIDVQSMNQLKKKIHAMESKLKFQTQTQSDLERMCHSTEQQLREREEEIKLVREQMKFQENRLRSSDGLMESMQKYVGGFLWGSSSSSFVHPISDYKIYEVRGNRKDGRVRRAIHTPSKQTVALKRVNFDPIQEPSLISSFSSWLGGKSTESLDPLKERRERSLSFREAMILFHLSCDYIVPLDGLVQSTPGEFHIQMPFFEFDLDYVIESRSHRFTEKEAQRLLYHILLAVYYMHSGNLVHRHLTSEAVLMNDYQRIQLGGFSQAVSLQGRSPTSSFTLTRQNVCFSAPELLYKSAEQQSLESWKPIDMWAVGCIFAHLLRNRPLFTSTSPKEALVSILKIKDCHPLNVGDLSNILILRESLEIVKHSKQESLSNLFPNVDPQALDLLRKLLEFHPSQRITVEQALEHSYFTHFPEKQIHLRFNSGHECTDSNLLDFVEKYCPGLL